MRKASYLNSETHRETTMIALIDGDILCYRSGFAAEHTHYLLIDKEQGVPVKQFDSYADFRAWAKENEDWEMDHEMDKYTTCEPVSHALSNVKSTVQKILDATNTNDFHIFLSSGTNFRGDVATIQEYKANRKDARKPVHYDAIHEYLQNFYGAIKYTSIEADDALAMCQTDNTVICSLDKDLLQVPGLHYNWTKEEPSEAKKLVTPEVGILKLYQQLLTGDSTDNIPGIYGVGAVKAKKIIVEANTTDADHLFAVCLDHWREYLTSADWCKVEDDMVKYHPWFDAEREIQRYSCEVVEEVLDLLTVGGEQAYDALQKSGEELPLSR
jgi:hypothetical protein